MREGLTWQERAECRSFAQKRRRPCEARGFCCQNKCIPPLTITESPTRHKAGHALIISSLFLRYVF